MSRLMTKPTKWNVHPAKTQVSLDGSESSLCAQWVAKDPSFLHADSEDWSDWADSQADLKLRWTHMLFCWFCREVAQMFVSDTTNPERYHCSHAAGVHTVVLPWISTYQRYVAEGMLYDGKHSLMWALNTIFLSISIEILIEHHCKDYEW